MSAETVEATDRPLFRALDGDDPDPEATVIDSLCMNCHEQVRIVQGSNYYQF